MLEVRRLCHSPSGNVAIQDLDLDVNHGEKIALIGLHNAGKSILLQILAGYIVPHQGSIRINGRDLRYDAQEARKSFGYVPNHPTINAEWKVEETFQMFASVRGMRFPHSTALVLAEKWGLEDHLSKTMNMLHFGQKMRVLLALATLHDPELLFLDDPFEGLDPKELRSIIDILGRVFSKSSMIIATNKIESLPPWIDRVILLEDGRIRLDQPFSGTRDLLKTLDEIWKEPSGNDQKNLDTLSP
ncbi:MAG: ABC transporter ATP-binding protein [Proteobacteria bacterium]|nr:MAG: ABC transporter ATP-binding protein [Pseudomonadota bacterium]